MSNLNEDSSSRPTAASAADAAKIQRQPDADDTTTSATAAKGQATEVTAATLERTLGESEDRILLRQTNSGNTTCNTTISTSNASNNNNSNNNNKLLATAHAKHYQRKASQQQQQQQTEKDDDTNSVTTTTSDVNSDDDSSSIVSRISQIVVEQEGKLMGCYSSDGEQKSFNSSISANQKHHHQRDKFRNSPTGSSGSTSSASGDTLNRIINAARKRKPSTTEFKVFPTEQLPEIHIDCEKDSRNGADESDRRQQPEVQPAPSVKKSWPQNGGGGDGDNGSRMRAKSVVEPSGESTYIRRNESSGYLPERGDLRDLETNRKLSHYASFSKGSNGKQRQQQQQHQSHARHRSDTAGSDDQSNLLDSGGGGGGGQMMLNIKRSTWTLNDFDQTFNKSSSQAAPAAGDNAINKSETSSINDGGLFERAGGAMGDHNDYIATDGFSTSIGMSPIMMNNATGSALPQTVVGVAGVAAAAAAAATAAVAASIASNKFDSNLQESKQPNNLLIRASKNAISLSQQEVHGPVAQQQPGGGAISRLEGSGRFISCSPSASHMYEQDRRDSQVSFALSCDSYCIRPIAGKKSLMGLTSKRRKRRGHLAATAGGSTGQGHDNNGDDDEQGSRSCLRSCFNMDTFGQFIPILQWLPNYNRNLIWGDLMAGLAVAVLNISTSLSAAVVAETDLGAAFRASIVNTFVYAVLCSSRHTSFGSWSIMSQMLFISVRRALSDELLLSRLNIVGPSALWDVAEYERWHLNIIIMYTFLIGLTQLIGGLLNLGNIMASFIPEALCSSMIAATAFTMAVGQLANMCGTSNKILWSIERNTTELWADLKNPPVDITDLFAGLFRWVQQIALLVKYNEQINLVCVLISVGSVIALFLNQFVIQKQLERQFKRKIFIPFEMILLIVMIILSYSLDLEHQYNVATCGPINMDFDIPTLPNLKLIRELWFESLTTALISYSMVYIMAKTYSNKLNYEVDCNQELIACGAGNMIGSLFDALPATASFSRTAGQVEAGGNTQMASIINCVVLVVLVKLLGHHGAALPLCVMSATLFYGFVRMMTRFMEVFNYWRVCKVDFAIWLVTFVAILTLDLINGFVYGFIFSIITMLYRAQNRRCYMLGCIGSADVYVPLDKYHLAQEIDGIKIFQFCGPIHYVCADLFERLLRRRTRVDVKMIAKHIADKEIVKFNPRDMNLPGHIILDFSMISFIDSAGITTIRKIIEDYDRVNVTVLFASLASHVAAVVKTEPTLWETYKDRFYITLADAVHCAIRDTRLQQSATAIGEPEKMA